MPEDGDDYKVGYGRPPKHTQYKKGQSGNQDGRPPGAKNLKTDLLEELAETMKIREDGHERRISKQRALIKTQVARALKGNDRAAAKILDLYLKLCGFQIDAAEAGVPLDDFERAIMQELEARILRQAGVVQVPERDTPDDKGGAS